MHVLAPSKCVLEKHNIVTPSEFLCNLKYFNGHLNESHRRAVQKREKTDLLKSVECAFNSSWEDWGALWDMDMAVNHILPADTHSLISFT